jgi:hypothetical protein
MDLNKLSSQGSIFWNIIYNNLVEFLMPQVHWWGRLYYLGFYLLKFSQNIRRLFFFFKAPTIPSFIIRNTECCL